MPRRTSADRRGEPAGRDFARRAERGSAVTFAILTFLLALAWAPFLRFGLALVREGRMGLGYGFILATAAPYLLLWLRARRIKELFVADARAGRIRMTPIPAPP